jgi:hypothetical protein
MHYLIIATVGEKLGKVLQTLLDKLKFTNDFFIVLAFILVSLAIAALVAYKSHWIIKPFYVTIIKIKEWHKK